MECSIGLHVLYEAAQIYRLGSSYLYFDKTLTRPLEWGETLLARVLLQLISFT